jgi:hypothetical protein
MAGVVLAAGLVVSTHAGVGADGPEKQGLLSGPRVEATNVTSQAARFTEPNAEVERVRAAMGMNPRVLWSALQTFEQAPEGVRLTNEQRGEVERHMRDFMVKMRAFERENREEMAKIRREAAAAGVAPTDRAGEPAGASRPRASQPQTQSDAPTDAPRRPARGTEPKSEPMRDASPDAPDAMMDEMVPARPAGVGDVTSLRARMMEINARGPSTADLERTIRGLLTEPQRVYLDEQVAKAADEARSERAMQQYTEEARAQFAKRREAGEVAASGDVDAIMARLPDRLRQRLEAMSPEDRTRAIEMLRQRRMQADAAGMMRGANGRDAGPKSTAKAPPSMDSVNVPKAADDSE